MENMVHTVTDVLGMIDGEEGGLSEYETWELLVSGVNENLGRLIEGNNKTHQVTGILLAKSIIGLLEKDGDRKKAPETDIIVGRVMRSIYTHGEPNSGDVLGDLVKQSNRFQQVEPRALRRSLQYGLCHLGLGLISHY